MTFGIPKQLLPVDSQGNVVRDWIEQFVEQRRLKEAGDTVNSNSQESSSLCVRCPTAKDVLLGRGRPFQMWNNHLGAVIDRLKERYYSSSRFEKTCLSIDVVNIIKGNGGRFLQRTNDQAGWVEVSDDVAREKVSSGFRTAIKRKRSQGTRKGRF